jgi:hypothetical protein
MSKTTGSPARDHLDGGVEICRCPACSSPFVRRPDRQDDPIEIEADIIRAPARRDMLDEARAC